MKNARDAEPYFSSIRLALRATVPHDTRARTEINVRGVIALRWVAVSGQLLTILFVHALLGVTLPLSLLFVVLGATAIVNLSLMVAHRVIPERWPDFPGRAWQHILGLTLLFDLAALTALLYLTGGISNPFSLFYFVNIVLAAILLPRGWVWSLTLLGVLCIGILHLWYQPLAEFAPVPADGIHFLGMAVPRLGSFVAYATCNSIIVLFMTWIRGQIEHLEDHVRELVQAKARSDRLDSLGTLAAGAAHELATPLSTIAVITKEVEHELVRRTVTDQTLADIVTIRKELDRCRDILNRMSRDAGLVIGESIRTVSVGELIRECTSGVDPRGEVRLTCDASIEPVQLRAPLEGLAQAVRALVKNAVDATGNPQDVSVQVAMTESKIEIRIEDQGTGIDPATLLRIGEPFFTTKGPGKGMGLGVYLARNVIERLGGAIEYTSRTGHGTIVTIQIPREFS